MEHLTVGTGQSEWQLAQIISPGRRAQLGQNKFICLCVFLRHHVSVHQQAHSLPSRAVADKVVGCGLPLSPLRSEQVRSAWHGVPWPRLAEEPATKGRGAEVLSSLRPCPGCSSATRLCGDKLLVAPTLPTSLRAGLLPVPSSQKHHGSGLGACLHSDPFPPACFVISRRGPWR